MELFRTFGSVYLKGGKDTKNQLDNMVYQLEKLYTDNKDKLPADEVTKAEEAVKVAKEVLAKDESSADDYKGEVERLTNLTHSLSSKLYDDQSTTAEAPTEGEGVSPDDEVIDVDATAATSDDTDESNQDAKDVN